MQEPAGACHISYRAGLERALATASCNQMYRQNCDEPGAPPVLVTTTRLSQLVDPRVVRLAVDARIAPGGFRYGPDGVEHNSGYTRRPVITLPQ